MANYALCHSFYLREGVKKNVFLGDLSQIWMGGGADSQTFADVYQPLLFSTKVPKCGLVGQSKPKTQSNFLGEIYQMHLIIPK